MAETKNCIRCMKLSTGSRIVTSNGAFDELPCSSHLVKIGLFESESLRGFDKSATRGVGQQPPNPPTGPTAE